MYAGDFQHEQAQQAKPKPQRWRDEPHAPWKSRWVLWAWRKGVYHVAPHVAIVGDGVVSQIACGGASGLRIEATTFYGMKNDGHKLCRRCVKVLMQAGDRGRIQRAGA